MRSAVVILAFAVVVLAGGEARAVCCIEGCSGPTTHWTSCTASSDCTGGFCDSPLGSAILTDPNATCGEGETFFQCPPDERGECHDGVNNDAWTGDVLTDCEDPDCFSDPGCPQHAPVASGTALVIVAGVLLALGVVALRSRRA
jgi:hypothetical protein